MTFIESLSPAVNLDTLLTDKQIAELLKLSPAWIRKERYLRRKGEPHSFSIDPVMIGDSPRYRASEIDGWLSQL